MLSRLRKIRTELHVVSGASASEFRRLHYLLHSFRRFAGECSESPVVITIAAERLDAELRPFVTAITNLGAEFRLDPQAASSANPYRAASLARFGHKFDCDIVLMVDECTLFGRPIDDMLRECSKRGRFSGVVAHVPPVRSFDEWQGLYDAFNLGAVPKPYEHTGWGYLFADESLRYCPPYFNAGVLCAPADMYQQLHAGMDRRLAAVDEVIQPGLALQTAIALGIAELNLPHRMLKMRYNFVNDPMIEALHGLELPHAAILRLDRDHQIDRAAVFADDDGIESMLARRDLRGVNAEAQRVLEKTHQLVLRDLQERAA